MGLPHFEYFEGAQRIQREAVVEVVTAQYRRSGLMGPNAHIKGCEVAAVGKFGRPKIILRRRALPDITVKVSR